MNLSLSELLRITRRLSYRVLKVVAVDRFRRARWSLISAMRGLPILNRIARSRITDMVSLLDIAGSEQQGVSELTMVSESRTVHFRTNETVPRKRGLSLGEVSCLMPEQFSCTIEEAFFNFRNGALGTKDGRIVAECLAALNTEKRVRWTGIYGTPTPRPGSGPMLKGLYSTIWGTSATNYGHWLIECLPRTALLEKLARQQSITLLMPENLPAFYNDSLSCCLPRGIRVEYLSDPTWVQLDRFVFLSFGRRGKETCLDYDCRDYVRRAVFNRFGLGPHQPRNRIYISRNVMATRRVINDIEVSAVLSRHGFSTVRPETLSFEEQVRLFHDAEMVVAAHGAGLSNILFSGPIKVLDMQAENVEQEFFFLFALSLNQDYRHLICSRPSALGDFTVDVERLEEMVKKMLTERGRTGTGI